jgi:hypothetical protein
MTKQGGLMVEELVHGPSVDQLGARDGGDTGLDACSEIGFEEKDEVCGGATDLDNRPRNRLRAKLRVPSPRNDQVKALTGGPRLRQSMWIKERSSIPGSLELLELFE